MRQLRYILFIVLVAVCLPSSVLAEEKGKSGFSRFMEKVGNSMTQSLMRGMDTTYVALPKNPFTAFAAYRMTSISHYINNVNTPWVMIDNDKLELAKTEIEVSSGLVNAIGVGIGYRNTMIRFYYTPGNRNGAMFNLSSYGHRFGGDILYQSLGSTRCYYSVHPSEEEGYDRMDMSKWGDDVTFARLCLNAYMVISPKKFSYPAAMRSSVIQKRSAGSAIASLTYYRTVTDISSNALTVVQWLTDDMRVSTNQIALGVGYAYNFVLPWNYMLVHLSATPMLTINLKNNLSGTPSEIREQTDERIIEAMDQLNTRFCEGHGVGFGCRGKIAISVPLSDIFYTSIDCDMFYFGAGSYDGVHTHTFDVRLNAVFGVRF